MITDIRLQIAESLKRRIGHQRFELWFGEPTSIAVESMKLRICAKDQFSLGRIRTQFDGDLKFVLKDFGAEICELKYEVSATAEPSASGDKEERLPICPKPASNSTRLSAAIRSDSVDRPAVQGTRELDFADFVFGEKNSLIENSVKQLIAYPGQISPFYLHGEVGCGKSVLLSRIVQNCRSGSRHRRGVYVTAEQFTSHFVEALKGRGLPVFRRKYRELDVLAVDDLQFFDNKRATLVEFQSTVDQLQRSGKQIILAADRPPTELGFLGPELTNRFSAGLVCRVHYPCETARATIFNRLCERRALTFPPKFVQKITQRLSGDVRQLNGAVNRLHAAKLASMNLDEWPSIHSLLQDLFQAGRPALSMETIEQAVCDVCGVGTAELRSPKRTKRINVARTLAMWLARKHTGSAFSEIGLHYGGRSHSTVISSQQKVHRWLQSGASIPLTNTASCPASDAIHRIECKLRIG